jgi:hypothetical protein
MHANLGFNGYFYLFGPQLKGLSFFRRVNSPSPDDSVFNDLALTYSKAHSRMHLGLPCPDEKESFRNGITNGAQWYFKEASHLVSFLSSSRWHLSVGSTLLRKWVNEVWNKTWAYCSILDVGVQPNLQLKTRSRRCSLLGPEQRLMKLFPTTIDFTQKRCPMKQKSTIAWLSDANKFWKGY